MDQENKQTSFDYDVIIVGSGVGGGSFADYLTRENQDLRVLILESGAYRDRTFFNQKEKDMTSIYYNRGATFSKNMTIGVAAANTVGGSSSVYTGVSFRPPTNVINKWRDEFGMDFLTDDFVERSLSEIEEDLTIHELPRSWDNQNNQLFEKGAKGIGIEVKRLKINVRNCKQQGFCNLGCTSGAKQGTLELQIPRVMDRGVELIANANVESIEENKVHLIVSDSPKGTRPNKHTSGKYTFTAQYIILAAGVLNTPTILLRSLGKLKIPKKNIGRYLTLHPALNINGVYKEEISNYTGFPKTMYSDHFTKSNNFYLETSFYYPGITAKNNPGYGEVHQEIMMDYAKLMSILILIHDKAEAHNRIGVDKNGKTKIMYSLSKDAKEDLVKALQVSTKLFFEAGCVKALIPGSSKALLTNSDKENLEQLIQSKYLDFSKTPLTSAHPQGGARIGKDESVSVCDPNGKVIGTKSIYVSDASLFPTSVAVNPYVTIMLLAKHVATIINKRLNN